MGTERERRGEMFLLLFLLASPAFGRPDNSQSTILELSEYFDILYELSELAQRTLSHVRDWKIKLEKLMANDDGHIGKFGGSEREIVVNVRQRHIAKSVIHDP